MAKLLTFNNDPAIKAEVLAKIKHHQDLDTYIQGQWLTNQKVEGNGFKGCFYGCTMQISENPINAFSDKYNIDLWYCHLTEQIFEGLPEGEYQHFPFDSIAVIPVGFDFNSIKSIWFKTTLLKPLDWVVNEDVRKILIDTAILFDTDFDKINSSAANAAYYAAANAAANAANYAANAANYAAANAAAYAAYAAANAANYAAANAAAYAAAYAANAAANAANYAAANAAAYAAYAAAYAANAAAANAAKQNHYIWLRDNLFSIIKNGYEQNENNTSNINS